MHVYLGECWLQLSLGGSRGGNILVWEGAYMLALGEKGVTKWGIFPVGLVAGFSTVPHIIWEYDGAGVCVAAGRVVTGHLWDMGAMFGARSGTGQHWVVHSFVCP